MLIEEIVDRNHDVLAEVLDNLGNKITAHVVPESLCHDLRDKLQSLLGLSRDALTPGPGGLFPELFEGLTLAAQDPDVHIHEWLRGKVPLGITTHIPPGGIFPIVEPQRVGREKDRLQYVEAKVWDTKNYSSYQEHKEKADKVFQNEIDKGYVQWAASRDVLEQDVGTLQLAKIAVVVKGDKVRLIHDMRRNGTNSKVTFHERLVLPRLKDVIQGVMELLKGKANDEGIDLLTLDFRDAFKQLHVVKSERPYLAGVAMGGFFFLQNCFIWRWIRSFGLVSGRSMDYAQHASMAGQRTCPNQLLRGRPHHRVERDCRTTEKVGHGSVVVVVVFGAEACLRERVFWSGSWLDWHTPGS